MKDNRFTFVMPAFNAEDTIAYSISSLMMQNYPNWNLVILDDMSADNTVDIIENLCKSHGFSEDKIRLIVNTEKKWEIQNVLEGLNHCDDNDIVCRMDGDDWLCDTDALTIINHQYKTKGVSALWTAHRWGFTNKTVSGPLPTEINPYKHPWVSSHLKTFRKSLLNGVKDENYRNSEGEYFKRIGDQVFYLPALYQSAGNWHYEPIIAYHYTIDIKKETFQSNDAKFQKSEAEELRSRGFIE